MTDDEKFEVWKSRVELRLELMVKKSIYDFDYYNYRRDFNNKTPPETTATRVIKKAYRQ
jgi:hypothetical protein